MIEENTVCIPDPLMGYPKALTSLLIVLGLLIATPWKINNGSAEGHTRIGTFLICHLTRAPERWQTSLRSGINWHIGPPMPLRRLSYDNNLSFLMYKSGFDVGYRADLTPMTLPSQMNHHFCNCLAPFAEPCTCSARTLGRAGESWRRCNCWAKREHVTILLLHLGTIFCQIERIGNPAHPVYLIGFSQGR